MITRRHTLLSQALLALLLLVAALAGGRGAAGAAQVEGASTVYLPLVVAPRGAAAPPPPAGSLPAQLVGTWFNGQVLNLQFYNRSTGVWGDAGGLGHMYVFRADGGYTLVSFLKLGEGTTCVSTVSKYQSGTARVSGGSLLLTPATSRTRTVTCGTSASDVEGSHATYSLPWQVGEDDNSHTRLWLTEVQGRTEYYKDGLGPQVVGDWANGDGGAIWLYDPDSGQWAEPTGERSEWYAFYADGTFRHGLVETGFGGDPCYPVTMRYEEGVLGGRGSNITLETTAAIRRTVSACDPEGAIEEGLPAGSFERWAWAVPAASAGERLDLLRVDGGFRSITLSRVN